MKLKTIIILTAVSIAVSAVLYACTNSKESDEVINPLHSSTELVTLSETPIKITSPEPDTDVSDKFPLEIIEKTVEINGRLNHVFLLTADITDPGVKIIPRLSFDKIFGFESLMEMTKSTGAYAAVTGGFFFEYGRPSGLVVNDGKVISAGTGKYESLIIEDGSVRFEKVETKIIFSAGGYSFAFDKFNESAAGNEKAIYSDSYGSTDRLGYLRNILVIKDGIVTEHRKAEKTVNIPNGGYVISLPLDFLSGVDLKGETVNIIFSPRLTEGAMAYEGASMLVQSGISLAGDIMPWIGNLNHYDPRTCVGIMNDGRVGFVVIDGRQENYSSGTTGRETADILIDMGFTDAMMLDGGASAEMIFNGETVNTPSSGGKERPLAGGFMIFTDGYE